MMGTNNFNLTPRAKKAYKRAKQIANDNAHSIINESHIFFGCLENLSEDLTMLFELNDIFIEKVDSNSLILEYLNLNPSKFNSEDIFDLTSWHPETSDIIAYAQKLSEIYENDYIGIEHIFYSILENCENLCVFLVSKNIDVVEIKNIVKNHIDSFSDGQAENNSGQETKAHIQNPTKQQSKNKSALAKYCKHLNTEALVGSFASISGREKEINELIEILSKKTKSNAIIVGEAGVGKSAIVEGFAHKIATNDIPANLIGSDIYSVDMALMISGTRYRGEFEERFKSVIDEALQNDKIILFFDEIHNIIGAGSSEGSLDAANILKPALARGGFKCIGATTNREYKKYFEKDSAIKRRFDYIPIDPPSKEQTKKMIEKSIESYENFHNVHYSPQIIETVINLCDSYIPHKNFPDKAFDIIDLVGSRVKIKNIKLPKTLKDTQDILMERLMNDRSFESKEEEDSYDILIESYIKEMTSFNENIFKNKFKIKISDVINVVSQKSGLSEDSISVDLNIFSNFKSKIENEIFGQSENLEKITNVLSCAKVGLNDPNKPLCSFFFVGPTSVGKTYTAKKIAKYFFGNEKSFIQINMSEYQDKTAISKLIGANAGYVGFEQGGLLTEFVKNNPNCVVLFDEVEKCEPEILNLLLHLLDEGYVNDNQNSQISFRKSIVILTSNIGHDKKDKRSVGFLDTEEDSDLVYKDAVKKYLKPEFVARINDILVFNPLSQKELELIISVELDAICLKLKKKNISILLNKTINKFILDKLELKEAHARNIKGEVISKIQIPLSKFIIQNPKSTKISAKIVDNELILA